MNLKFVSLVVLIAQSTSLVIMLRFSRLSDTPYFSSTAVLNAEMLKLAICVLMICYSEGSLVGGLNRINIEVIKQPRNTLKLAVPAGLYAVQNNLLFFALSNLEAAMYQVVYQLKILTTALFSVVMLRKKLTRTKWFALVVLMMGVTLVQSPGSSSSPTVAITSSSSSVESVDGAAPAVVLAASRLLLAALNEQPPETHPSPDELAHGVGPAHGERSEVPAQYPMLGLIAVLIACCSSGFAGVYFEKMLKTSKTSLWVRNIQLSIFGALFSALLMVFNDGAAIWEKGYFYGYNPMVCSVVCNQAVGGLVVAMVVKHADNIVKGFANSISIIFGSMISWYMFDFHITSRFVLGGMLVIGAVFLYGAKGKTRAKVTGGGGDSFTSHSAKLSPTNKV